MILELKLPAYIVAYLKALYGEAPYNLANQNFRFLRAQIKWWNLIAEATPQSIIMPRTKVPVQFQIPDGDKALVQAANMIQNAEDGRREAAFINEFWTSMTVFVIAQREIKEDIQTGESIENFLVAFDIPDEALSTDSARRMYNRFLEDKPSLAALSRIGQAS
jgi:hypothetical protein